MGWGWGLSPPLSSILFFSAFSSPLPRLDSLFGGYRSTTPYHETQKQSRRSCYWRGFSVSQRFHVYKEIHSPFHFSLVDVQSLTTSAAKMDGLRVGSNCPHNHLFKAEYRSLEMKIIYEA